MTDTARAAAPRKAFKMATTTSVEHSGLLDILLPAFKKATGITVHAIAVGTGNALKLGENGDVDCVLVHAPDLEMKFVQNGFGIGRRVLFYNDFLIVGPPDDPAGIAGSVDPMEALAKIAGHQSVFVSRGDNSGTHNRERYLWQRSGVAPGGGWYLEAGQGMGSTLIIADEKGAYCLVDRGTFLAFEDKIGLVELSTPHEELLNVYSVIAVDPGRHPNADYGEVSRFINWLVSDEAKELVNGFKKNGKQLFHYGVPAS
ncbi:MAG: substrate-binding domain-containing protein [Candidatus Omnitrophota bacterium]